MIISRLFLIWLFWKILLLLTFWHYIQLTLILKQDCELLSSLTCGKPIEKRNIFSSSLFFMFLFSFLNSDFSYKNNKSLYSIYTKFLLIFILIYLLICTYLYLQFLTWLEWCKLLFHNLKKKIIFNTTWIILQDFYALNFLQWLQFTI